MRTKTDFLWNVVKKTPQILCLQPKENLPNGHYKKPLLEHLVDSNKLEDFKNKFIDNPSEYQDECKAIIERIFKPETGAIEKEIAKFQVF